MADMSIFIKNLSIKNYKCWSDRNIKFATPNGNRGSGLNFLIGENGNGKTAVLEAINFLTLGNFSIENTLNINDFTDYKKEIEVQMNTDVFNCESSIDYFRGWTFEASAINFSAKSRESKERGKLLSAPYEINKHFEVSINQYKKADGSTADKGGEIRSIDGRDLFFENSRIINDELNIFFFDKNRTRQISTGNYKTTFDKICDDLNWNFVKNINEGNKTKIIENIAGEYFKKVEEITSKNVGLKTATDLKDFFGKDEYEKLKIELLEMLHPFNNSFFALRNENDLTQVSIKDLGSGVEMILTLLLLKNIAGSSKGSIIYLIDEPELHLHPKAQEKLLDLLLEEAKTKQILVSTHSPYLFKGAISENANLLLFTRNKKDEIVISDAREEGWGLFDWSPSWGEINYFAYGMPTIEFHDELYGFLHEQFISISPNQKEAERRNSVSVFDKEFLQAKMTPTKGWTQEFGGKPEKQEVVALSTFIRHKVHHPENKTMKSEKYTPQEFLESLQKLIEIANGLKSQ